MSVQQTEADGGFEAIIQVDALETLFESVNTLVDECKVRLTDDGLQICAVDPANVAMVDADLATDAFESYRTEGGVIGINVDRILDVLSVPDSDDLAHLFYDPERTKLVIEVDSFEYTLALIDPESIRQEPNLPELDLTARLVLEGEQLGRALTAADITASSSSDEHVRLRCADEAIVHIEAEGDTDDMDYTFDTNEALDLSPGEADSLFSLDYWSDIAKPIGKDDRVAIRFGEELPARLAYSAVDGRLHLDYMVSPRIQS